MRGTILIAFALLALPITAAIAADEPPHDIIVEDGAYQLRQYKAMLVAEVTVSGSMRRASNKGFRLLADFIFGNNKPAEKIEMTAPVIRTESSKIEMTAPVSRVENDDNSWTIAFVMPAQWTLESLPKPNNRDVSIREVAPQTIATIKFSGRGNEASHRKKQNELEQWIDQQGYSISGEPRYAGYDAPWVIWPLRRNEVMIPVVKKE